MQLCQSPGDSPWFSWEDRTQLEIAVYSSHIFYIIFVHDLVHFRNSHFMYKMCIWRVVSMCVTWSAYIKENITHLLCTLYIIISHVIAC